MLILKQRNCFIGERFLDQDITIHLPVEVILYTDYECLKDNDMSPTNRFYTPSLPVYTSQFVEDMTPWQDMIALEQQKIGRSDAALQGAAEAESEFSSLVGGYRSQGIVPEVINEYSQQLKSWQEKHGNALYTVPALRELTKIQGRFQADPRVKLAQQDVHDNRLWDQMRMQEGYDERTDPNVDPETGGLKQFTPADTYRPYDRPYYKGDMTTFMNKFYDPLEPDETQTETPDIDEDGDEVSGSAVDAIMADDEEF
jgi:hypothetical protein